MANRAVITCLSPSAKETLDILSDQDLRELLAEIPECSSGDLHLESDAKAEKTKRAPSKYNIFVGECLKDRPEGAKVTEFMKTCAIRWKSLKNN